MERKINYTLVGLFITGSTLLLILALLWLGKVEYEQEYDHYTVYFQESVSGLNIGSPVKYRGIKVGTVENLSIDPKNPELVKAAIKVKRGTPIRQDTRAHLAYQGITGLAYIELTGGTRHSPPLKPRNVPPYPVIETKPSIITRLDQVITKLSQRTETLVTRLTLLLSPENLQSLSTTLKNLSLLSTSLASQRKEIETTLQNLATTSRGLPALVEETRIGVRKVSTKTEQLLDLLAKDETQVTQLLKEIHLFIQNHGEPLALSAQSSLEELKITLEEAQETLETTKRTLQS
ncbi:MAG: hypothetical protein DRI93_05825, partial [Aquificota bacterium]